MENLDKKEKKMSEIKGQILGVLLVLAIFGSVAGVMISMFNNTTNEIENKLSEEISSFNENTTQALGFGELVF